MERFPTIAGPTNKMDAVTQLLLSVVVIYKSKGHP